MFNYRLLIQYDGGRYKGWQRLGDDDNTIQGKIENVLSEMAGYKIEIIGSSRTDAGVHALTQIANFKLKEEKAEVDIKKYLNRYLPQDISVLEVTRVHERFHARYNTKDKTYVYKIWNEEHTNPFIRKHSMHVEKRLDVETMKVASRHFLGEHDFTAFSNAKSKKKSMVREIYSLEIEGNEGLIEIRISGNGFLYNMVRKIVGILIEVGLGKQDPNSIPTMLKSKERFPALMAEPQGLFLEKISFKE